MQAAKHALTQYITSRGSISLAQLSIGVAMARASSWDKVKFGESKYIRPFLGTLVIAIVFGLVNSAYVQAQYFATHNVVDRAFDSWTTFLSPVQVHVLVPVNGKELDLGSQAFDAVLGQDTNDTFITDSAGIPTIPST